MILLKILKYALLSLAIVYTFSNVAKVMWRSQKVTSYQLWLMAIGIAGYILLEFELNY